MSGLASYQPDPNDFTDRYNTTLSPKEEQEFLAWAKAVDKLKDLYNYDLRGIWKDTPILQRPSLLHGHMSDRYKKPNHPTFSDESIYHNADGFEGGHWYNFGDNRYAFIPGRTNTMPVNELASYFRAYEPDSVLMDMR